MPGNLTELMTVLRSPAISVGFTILGEIFAYVTVFNPTIEVVTFRLHGWCMLDVFLLPAFTRLGHECQDLWSGCNGMHMHRLDQGLYSHPKVFWGNGVRTHVNSKGKIPSTRKILLIVVSNPWHCIKQRAQHTTNELFRPPHGSEQVMDDTNVSSTYNSEVIQTLLHKQSIHPIPMYTILQLWSLQPSDSLFVSLTWWWLFLTSGKGLHRKLSQKTLSKTVL